MAEKRVKFTTTIKKSIVESVKKIAEEEGRHLNYYIERSLQNLISEYEKKKKSEEKIIG
jgi:hypothetical protein